MATLREIAEYLRGEDDRPRRTPDRGAPGQAHGAGAAARNDRRAGRAQVVTTNVFGRTTTTRGGKSGRLKDRWR